MSKEALKRILVVTALLASTESVVTLAASEPSAAVCKGTEDLERTTQALADAFAPGDRTVWKQYTDSAFVYVTEDNEVKTRTKFLEDLTPLPKGSTGHIEVREFRCTGFDTFAVTTYIMDEHETVQGQQLNARYRVSDTWRTTMEGWRLVASQAYAVPLDPPSRKLPAQRLAEYEGEYSLGSQIRVRIRRDRDHLIAERTTGPPVIFLAEITDVFFTPGRPRIRRIFTRAPDGTVNGFDDRREGADLHWTRVTQQKAEAQ